MELNINVREAREKAGLTVKELAEKSGLEESFITMLEDDQVNKCNSTDLIKLAEALGLSVSELTF